MAWRKCLSMALDRRLLRKKTNNKPNIKIFLAELFL